jgi:hypothetical protein
MKRFTIPRVAHCGSGHGKVPDMTENCPQHFIRKRGEKSATLFERGIAG